VRYKLTKINLVIQFILIIKFLKEKSSMKYSIILFVFLFIFLSFSCELLILNGEGPSGLVANPQGNVSNIEYFTTKDQARYTYTIYNTGETDIYNSNFNIQFTLDETPYDLTDNNNKYITKSINISQVIYRGQHFSGDGNFMLSKINGVDNDGTGYVTVVLNNVSYVSNPADHTSSAIISFNVKNITTTTIDECELHFKVELVDGSFCYGYINLSDMAPNVTITSGLSVSTYEKALKTGPAINAVKFYRFFDCKEYYEQINGASVNSVQFKK
jgi:hypothetical protein